MKYIIHFLFFCFSYSYLIDSPLLSNQNENLRKNNKRHKDKHLEENNRPTMAVERNHHKHDRVNKNNGHHKNNSKKNHMRSVTGQTPFPFESPVANPKMLRNKLDSDSYSSDSDSEREDFQSQYKLEFNGLMHQAMITTTLGYLGDRVHVLAARPWGVPCGDSEQRKPRFGAPKGSCMLSHECEPEFRIYRGDSECGRTEYVCCGVMENAIDLVKPSIAADMSFDSASFDTDSTEIRTRLKGAGNTKKVKNTEDTQRRREERDKRKKEIKEFINRILKEINRLLNKSLKDGTKKKYKKSKQLKLFLADLKKQYKKDRQAVKDVQEVNVIRIDLALRDKLEELRKFNNNFMNNETLRNIIFNAQHTMTMGRTDAVMLMQSFPELTPYFNVSSRRDNRDNDSSNEGNYGNDEGYRSNIYGKIVLAYKEDDEDIINNIDEKNVLAYDVEYGLMYF